LATGRSYRADVPSATRHQQLVENLLGEDLQAWVVLRRNTGASWRSIATELVEQVEGRCDVHPETLRGWFVGLEEPVPLGQAT
jgi:hypothetical protein